MQISTFKSQQIWIVQWEDYRNITQQNLFLNEEAAIACYERLLDEKDYAEYNNLEKFWQWADDIDHGGRQYIHK